MDDCFSRALDQATYHARRHLAALDESPVAPMTDLASMRARLIKPLNEGPIPADQVIGELVADSSGGIVGCASGRFFAWVVGGALPAALAADWLTSAWDQNAGIYASGPAAAVAEEACGEWLKDLLNVPVEASFALVTGCQMAHATCLTAARNHLLRERGWDPEERGLFGAPRIRILTSTERHGTFLRAVRLLGLGKGNIVGIPVDANGMLRAEDLESELQREPTAPTIVLLQAGDLNIGAYDPFATLIPVAKRFGAWVHVDGAFGLWAACSPRFRNLLEGASGADSWATDGHKWLNVPYDSGYAFVRDRAAHMASMSHRESYLIHDSEARDQMDWNPEWSRRARGFATYAALRQLGRQGIASLIERCCDHARAIVEGIGALPGAEVVWTPQINQGLVAFSNNRTDEIIARVNRSGEAFFGGTEWRGRRCMRVSVCNWMTSDSDVKRAVEAVRSALRD
ncbi:MAG TPA: aminotransferase class V-fold PLP-dependent enzyme [Bryobacteraceae bacterium]|nr:aminotransferase class V-fold PLP-dependent enzyme [Bryobacteraceae bacterium]